MKNSSFFKLQISLRLHYKEAAQCRAKVLVYILASLLSALYMRVYGCVHTLNSEGQNEAESTPKLQSLRMMFNNTQVCS